jgi:hypothetical protein
MQKSDVSAFIKKRKAVVGAVLGSLLMAGLLFAMDDKDGAIDELEAARRMAAAQLVCEVKLQRGEPVDCSQIVVTPTAPPTADALPVSFASTPPPPEPAPALAVLEPEDHSVDALFAEKDARIAILEEQLGMERSARVDAESRSDRLREALAAASDETDAAINNALNQMENERANQVCFSRAQWDADRSSLASLCSAAGLGVGLD